MGYLGVPRGATGSRAVTRGCFCLSQPLPVPPDGSESIGHCGAPTLPCGGAPGRHCGYITLFWVVGRLQISPGAAKQRFRHLLAEVVAGGWLHHHELCRRNRLSSSCLPCERHPHPTPDVEGLHCQQLPSTLLSTSFCGSPFGQVLSG